MISTYQRIELLDVARGFGILGILGLNIFLFALPFEAMVIPGIWGEATLVNLTVWEISVTGFSGVMRGIVSIAFGASAYLLLTRAEAEGSFAGLDRYFVRLLVLILFGVLHSYILLWPHDILYVYGVIGLLIFPFRKLAPKALFMICAVMLTASSIFTAENVQDIEQARETIQESIEPDERRELQQDDPFVEEFEEGFLRLDQGQDGSVHHASDLVLASDSPTVNDAAEETTSLDAIVAAIAKEIEERRQGYAANFWTMAPQSFQEQSEEMISNHLLDVGTFFLLGMALFKYGFLTGQCSHRSYRMVAIVGMSVGVSVGILSRIDVAEPSFLKSVSDLATEYGYDIRRLSLALSYLAILALLLRYGRLRLLTNALAHCGRVALTLYILQTIICNFIFLGAGLGLFGSLEHWQIGLLFLVLTALQIGLASWLANTNRQGPLERLLRWIVSKSIDHEARAASVA